MMLRTTCLSIFFFFLRLLVTEGIPRLLLPQIGTNFNLQGSSSRLNQHGQSQPLYWYHPVVGWGTIEDNSFPQKACAAAATTLASGFGAASEWEINKVWGCFNIHLISAHGSSRQTWRQRCAPAGPLYESNMRYDRSVGPGPLLRLLLLLSIANGVSVRHRGEARRSALLYPPGSQDPNLTVSPDVARSHPAGREGLHVRSGTDAG